MTEDRSHLLLQSTASRARELSGCSSRAREHGLHSVAHGLSYAAACGIFPDHRSNLSPLRWQAGRVFTTEPLGKT